METMTKSIVLLCLVLAFVPVQTLASGDIISTLSHSLSKAETEQEKSRLHIYRARNYNNSGNFEKAEDDYDAALQYDHKGWIHLERARFYLLQGNHQQARKEAVAAKSETPTLELQASKILARAKRLEKKELRLSKPKEILLTKRWEVTYRQTPSTSSKKSVRRAYAQKSKATTKRKTKKRGRS